MDTVLVVYHTAWKVLLYEVISDPYFSPNTGKYGPKITPYLDTFHAVSLAVAAPKTITHASLMFSFRT